MSGTRAIDANADGRLVAGRAFAAPAGDRSNPVASANPQKSPSARTSKHFLFVAQRLTPLNVRLELTPSTTPRRTARLEPRHAAAAGGDLGKAGLGLDERLYYLQDANFNTTALVQGTPEHADLGKTVERYLYDPYGRVTVLHGDADADDPVTECDADAASGSSLPSPPPGGVPGSDPGCLMRGLRPRGA